MLRFQSRTCSGSSTQDIEHGANGSVHMNWRGHQTSSTVVNLKGKLPQKLQSKSTLSCDIVQIHSLFPSWFYKETEIII